MKNFSIDKETILFLYRKHRDYIIPVSIIIVCFFLLLKVTIPLLEDLSVKQQEVKVEKDKLAVLQKNLNILNSTTSETLDKNLALTTSALPIEKNFAGILNSVSIAANKAGVSLGDYDFQVGDISKTATIGKTTPSLQLSLSVNGGVAGAIKFISELYKSLPLSEVSTVELNNSRSVITAVFYFKSFASGNINNSLSVISKADSATLSEISTWNNGNLELNLPVINSASSSATASPSAKTSPF